MASSCAATSSTSASLRTPTPHQMRPTSRSLARSGSCKRPPPTPRRSTRRSSPIGCRPDWSRHRDVRDRGQPREAFGHCLPPRFRHGSLQCSLGSVPLLPLDQLDGNTWRTSPTVSPSSRSTSDPSPMLEISTQVPSHRGRHPPDHEGDLPPVLYPTEPLPRSLCYWPASLQETIYAHCAWVFVQQFLNRLGSEYTSLSALLDSNNSVHAELLSKIKKRLRTETFTCRLYFRDHQQIPRPHPQALP